MTGLSAASKVGWRENVVALAAIVVLSGTLIGGGFTAVKLLTGGFTSNDQVNIERVSGQVAEMQGQVSKLTEAFNAQSLHVDKRIGDITEQQHADELIINTVSRDGVDVEKRVTRLENGVQVRLPPR